MFKQPLPTWIVAIVVVLVLQTVTATMGRLVPVAAPAFTREFGWDQAWVGYLAAASIVALGVPLLWGLATMALVPLSAAVGVLMGAIAGLKRHRRHLVADEQPVPDEAAP